MLKALSIFLKYLCILIALHFIGLLVSHVLLNGTFSKLPSSFENFLSIVFIGPEIIWSSPWSSILSKFGLMQGDSWHAPSVIGFAVVDAAYIMVLLTIRAFFESVSTD